MTEITTKIKAAETIIFDLGGVVVDLDISRSILAFGQLGLSGLADEIGAGHHKGILSLLEKGYISEDDFFRNVQSLSNKTLTVEDIENGWNAMLVALPPSRVRFLEKLKQEKPIILLSNTNSIHHRYFDGMASGYQSLSQLFNHVWYSYQMHLSKPDPEIFKRVLGFHGLKASATLFVDDSHINIEAAESVGLQTWHVKPGRGIDDVARL